MSEQQSEETQVDLRRGQQLLIDIVPSAKPFAIFFCLVRGVDCPGHCLGIHVGESGRVLGVWLRCDGGDSVTRCGESRAGGRASQCGSGWFVVSRGGAVCAVFVSRESLGARGIHHPGHCGACSDRRLRPFFVVARTTPGSRRGQGVCRHVMAGGPDVLPHLRLACVLHISRVEAPFASHISLMATSSSPPST
jgi:hypothetical protein